MQFQRKCPTWFLIIRRSAPFQAEKAGTHSPIFEHRMKGIDSGGCVFFPSSCAAGSPTHTHKVDLSVGHCPYLSPSSQKSKSLLGQNRSDFFTSILGFPIQRNAGYNFAVEADGGIWNPKKGTSGIDSFFSCGAIQSHLH